MYIYINLSLSRKNFFQGRFESFLSSLRGVRDDGSVGQSVNVQTSPASTGIKRVNSKFFIIIFLFIYLVYVTWSKYNMKKSNLYVVVWRAVGIITRKRRCSRHRFANR